MGSTAVLRESFQMFTAAARSLPAFTVQTGGDSRVTGQGPGPGPGPGQGRAAMGAAGGAAAPASGTPTV